MLLVNESVLILSKPLWAMSSNVDRIKKPLYGDLKSRNPNKLQTKVPVTGEYQKDRFLWLAFLQVPNTPENKVRHELIIIKNKLEGSHENGIEIFSLLLLWVYCYNDNDLLF